MADNLQMVLLLTCSEDTAGGSFLSVFLCRTIKPTPSSAFLLKGRHSLIKYCLPLYALEKYLIVWSD